MATTYPFWATRRLAGGVAAPAGGCRGAVLVRPSPCVCHPVRVGVCTHAGSGPSRVRRHLLQACLRDPIPLATCPRFRQVSRAINVPIIIKALLLLDIQIRMRSSGYINVFQWNREWFFSRRIKRDSGFNLMAVFEASRHGPEIVHGFTGKRK